MDDRTGDGVTEWVRAADAARMLNRSRELVRQLGESGALTIRRGPNRQVWVLVADIEERLSGHEYLPLDKRNGAL